MTQLAVVTEGGRVSVVDNTLWPVNEARPCATVRVTLSRERAIDVPGFTEAASDPVDPTQFPRRTLHLVQGRQWFMDAMETRTGDGVAWFRLNHRIIEGCRTVGRRTRPGGLDLWHRTAVPERGGRPQSEPDGPALQAASRGVGRRPRANPLDPFGRIGRRQRHLARRPRRDWPRFDVGDSGAVSEVRGGRRLANLPAAEKSVIFRPIRFPTAGFAVPAGPSI
jgi:hypothetical protein